MMENKVILITGATNGIGEVTARELARQGATVVIAGRNPEKTARVQAEIKAATGNQNVDTLIADLSLMSDVRKLADEFTAKYDHLHVLVNNAGALFTSHQTTSEGYEMTFALNHLNYFLLTHLLLDTLKASATPDFRARIVNVSSDAHQSAKIRFDNLQYSGGYNAFGAYAQSKLMNIMFTYELSRRLQAESAPVDTNALHPGLVATGFGKNNGFLAKTFISLLKPFAKNPAQGAETSIHLASSPAVEGVTGKYFADSKEKKSNAASYDVEAQQRLWQLSEELTGINVPASV